VHCLSASRGAATRVKKSAFAFKAENSDHSLTSFVPCWDRQKISWARRICERQILHSRSMRIPSGARRFRSEFAPQTSAFAHLLRQGTQRGSLAAVISQPRVHSMSSFHGARIVARRVKHTMGKLAVKQDSDAPAASKDRTIRESIDLGGWRIRSHTKPGIPTSKFSTGSELSGQDRFQFLQACRLIETEGVRTLTLRAVAEVLGQWRIPVSDGGDGPWQGEKLRAIGQSNPPDQRGVSNLRLPGKREAARPVTTRVIFFHHPRETTPGRRHDGFRHQLMEAMDRLCRLRPARRYSERIVHLRNGISRRNAKPKEVALEDD